MQRILTFCLLLAFMVYGVFSATGQPTNQWRVSTKVRTVGSQKYLFEYTYSNDGRIQTVKQYSATGALIITISDFKFDKNGKPSYYLVDWNREGLSAKIYLEYDNNRRLIKRCCKSMEKRRGYFINKRF